MQAGFLDLKIPPQMRQVWEGRESNAIGVGEVGRGRENVGSLRGENDRFL